MASNVPSSDQLYRPIHSYQTRLLRLDGDDGLPDSQISCSLHTADLLHPNIEGLLVRSIAGATESLIEYDALSYAWGSGGKDSSIRCNGLQVSVTENLFEALRALQTPKNGRRYLWVDALCINQDDSSEKNAQVWNMLAIYQKARIVIAWLGAAEIKMEHLLLATSANPSTLSSDGKFNFWSAVEGMSYLYKRPWFKRLWVQQEIFAARKLELQCGNHRFKWSRLLSHPKLLLDDPHLRSRCQFEKDHKHITHATPDEIQRNAISSLDDTRRQNLKCFKLFSRTGRAQPSFVHTLVDTALLDATNPRDYIYGILGMTGYPAKPMQIQDWLMARHTEVFIPIDYSADLTSIMCTVTWVLLMKDGLEVLARFKVFDVEHHGAYGKSLPSWVIDWRHSARLFHEANIYEHKSAYAKRDLMQEVWHLRFCKDNKYHDAKNPYNKLILRGTPDSRFYIKGNSVCEKGLSRAWHVQTDVQTTDLIVRMHAYGIRGVDHEGGFWLLRPVVSVGDNEFKLIAFLAPGGTGWESLNQCRRLAVTPENGRYWGFNSLSEFGGPTEEELDSANARKYTVV